MDQSQCGNFGNPLRTRGRTAWFHDGWVDEVLGQIERSFDSACDRWRSLYRSATHQRNLHHAIIGDHSRPETERKHSQRLRAQAESQIRLLTEAEGVYEGDFYSYRYFATEGFLTRLQLSPAANLRLRAREDAKSRGATSSYPGRASLQFRSSDPGRLIYHEGARYRVYKVNLDFSSNSLEDTHQLTTETMKRCQRMRLCPPRSGCYQLGRSLRLLRRSSRYAVPHRLPRRDAERESQAGRTDNV